jgi:hydroxyacylglutathione hydrolase
VFLAKRIKNKPVDSNSYVIYRQGESSCVVIDPGTAGCADLLEFIHHHRIVPDYIFLTHEHFDHIWGVNKLKDSYHCKIVCTQDCAEKIVDKKKNMSIFYDQVGFETYSADIIVNNNSKIQWSNSSFVFMETPGHTDGCLCISIDDKLFTGDTILKEFKTVVKLPGGSKKKLRRSLELIFSRFNGKSTEVYPGHGTIFFLEESSLENCYPV